MHVTNRMALGSLLLMTAGAPLMAADQGLQNPPLVQWQQRTAGPQLLLGADQGEKSFTWRVGYTRSQLYNPMTGRNDAVNLRSYQGSGIDPQAPFVAPTLVVRPGDTLRARLDNALPADPSCTSHAKGVNDPHCFNGTNMHTHGLWINPAGNSDNVLISINPGVQFEYEYNIPADHPAGTFWYHPHRHGSTAIQVASGMAGALLIKGDRAPTLDSNGDLDTLLRDTVERVMLFQQIQYYCNGDGSKAADYQCDPGQTGKIEGYGGFGPGGWSDSGRFTSINGRVQPVIQAQMGQVERWRLIHAGVRDSINFSIRKANTSLLAVQRSTPQLLAAGAQSQVEQLCSGAKVPQQLVAADGLTLRDMQPTDMAVLQPGYRFDALTAFPEAGDYCVIDEAAVASANVDRVGSSRQLLAIVRVSGQGKVDPGKHIHDFLVGAAKAIYSAPVAQQVIGDINRGSLARFTAHAPIAAQEITGRQTLAFNIDVKANPVSFQIDGKPYDPQRIDRELQLGAVEEWELTSNLASHPFHIHVNPFEVVAVYDPNGKDVSAAGAIDDFDKCGLPDTQYAGLKGAFKDTMWVKSVTVKNNCSDTSGVSKSYKVLVRTRYQRYIGDFVLHCHILDHEDQGMMQNVRIGLPDGAGGVSRGHH